MRANDKKKKINNNAHHKVLNQASNQQINQQKQKKKKKKWSHLEVLSRWVWSMSASVLKKSLFIIPFYWWVILLPIKCKKVRWSKRKCHGNGFQNWVFQRNTKTQKSKEIFKGMVEIKFRSLEKWFSKQEMVVGKEKMQEEWSLE